MARTMKENLTGMRATAGNRVLQFGLVSFEVAMAPLFDSLKSSRPEAHKYCPEHDSRVKQRWECETEGELVPEPKRGFDFDGGVVYLDESELEALKSDSDSTINLTAFVPSEQIDAIFFEKGYLLWPQTRKDAERYMILLRVLREKDDGYLVGVTHGDHGNAKTFAVRFCEETGTLVAHLCTPGALLRREQAGKVQQVIEDADEPSEEMVALAGQVFDSLASDFDPLDVADEYGERLTEAVKSKALNGEVAQAAVPAQAGDADDLMERLRASVEGSTKKKKARPKSKARS